MQIYYVNGSFEHKSDALISVEDRGFNFSDGVYEVIGFKNKINLTFSEIIYFVDQSVYDPDFITINDSEGNVVKSLFPNHNSTNDKVLGSGTNHITLNFEELESLNDEIYTLNIHQDSPYVQDIYFHFPIQNCKLLN